MPAERRTAVRPFWSGVVTFGLVSIPVDLFSAVRSSRVDLRMLGPGGHPLRRRYVHPERGTPVEETVRGFEVEPGRFVTVSEEELTALEPDRTREIDLRRFVDRAAIDPVFCDRPYFLLPQGEVTKPYRLLARTMEDTGQAGIASFVMRGREQLVAIFAEHGILRAETLRHADEVRTPEDVGLPEPVAAAPDRVAAFREAIEALAADALDTDELKDDRAEALRALAKRKSGGDVVHVEEVEAEEEDEDVVDLMALLRQRLGLPPADDEADADRPPPRQARDDDRPQDRPQPGQDRPQPGQDRPQPGQDRPAPAKGDRARLEGLTKKELYERAQARDIPGRSRMSREELIEALA